MNTRRTDVALLLVRVILGVVFFAHGSQKLFGWFGGHGLQATVAGMGKMGMPTVVPYLVSYGEVAAGLGLIVGLFSRIAAAGMFVEMLGAVLIVHGKNGFFAENHGFEYPLVLCVGSLAIALLGGGAYSLDAAFKRKRS
jgi:putative oxidoreductase